METSQKSDELNELLDKEGIEYAQPGADGKFHVIPLSEAGALLESLYSEDPAAGPISPGDRGRGGQ